jgi:hypothetical protein
MFNLFFTLDDLKSQKQQTPKENQPTVTSMSYPKVNTAFFDPLQPKTDQPVSSTTDIGM